MSQFIDQAKALQLPSLIRDLKVSITPRRSVIPSILPAKFTYILSNESPFPIVYQTQSSGASLIRSTVNFVFVAKQQSSTFEITHEKTVEIKSQLVQINILPWIGKTEPATTAQIKMLFAMRLPAIVEKIKLSRPVEWHDHLMNIQSPIKIPNGISKFCAEKGISKNIVKQLSMNEFDAYQMGLSNAVEQDVIELSSSRKATKKTKEDKDNNEK